MFYQIKKEFVKLFTYVCPFLFTCCLKPKTIVAKAMFFVRLFLLTSTIGNFFVPHMFKIDFFDSTYLVCLCNVSITCLWSGQVQFQDSPFAQSRSQKVLLRTNLYKTVFLQKIFQLSKLLTMQNWFVFHFTLSLSLV